MFPGSMLGFGLEFCSKYSHTLCLFPSGKDSCYFNCFQLKKIVKIQKSLTASLAQLLTIINKSESAGVRSLVGAHKNFHFSMIY